MMNFNWLSISFLIYVILSALKAMITFLNYEINLLLRNFFQAER